MEILISIIICTRDRAESLRGTLDALVRVRVPACAAVELVVVDNGSTDGTEQVVRDAVQFAWPCRYFSEPRRGLSHARNTALAHARGAVLLFTDDDVRPPADWVEKMCGPILEGRADAVAGEIEPAAELERPWLAGFVRTLLACTKHEPRIDLVGANMAVRRELLDQVGGFNTELGAGQIGAGEETLVSFQLEALGFRIRRARDVCVEHHFGHERLEPKAFLAGAVASGRSIGYIAHHWKHEVLPRARWQCLMWTVKLHSRRLLTPGRWRHGVPPWEVSYVRMAALHAEYLRQRSHPRKYEKHGLMKGKPLVVDVEGARNASVAPHVAGL